MSPLGSGWNRYELTSPEPGPTEGGSGTSPTISLPCAAARTTRFRPIFPIECRCSNGGTSIGMISRRSRPGSQLSAAGARGGWAVVSVLAHVGFILWASWSLRPPSRLAPTPDMEVWLTRTMLPPSHPTVVQRQQRLAHATQAPLSPAPRPEPLPEYPPETGNLGTGRGVVPSNGLSAGLGAALGAMLGCQPERLKALGPDQRAACERRLVETAKAAPQVDQVPAGKRAYYDAVRDAYQARHAPTPVALAAPPCPNCERWAAPPGTHMPSIGCAIPLGVPPGWKPDLKKRPHALTLGPCSIGPPQGFLTEEADIPSAAETSVTRSDRPPP